MMSFGHGDDQQQQQRHTERKGGWEQNECERAAAEALQRKLALQAANLEAQRLDAASLKTLDSSLKKVTPFLKKVRYTLSTPAMHFTARRGCQPILAQVRDRLVEETRASLVAEARRLNLSKYVEEVTSA